MEQHQRLHTGLSGDLVGVPHSAVTPVVAAPELLGRVLGVVDQNVGAGGQGQDGIIHDGRIGRLLVVADVHHRLAGRVDAITVRGADMGDGGRRDRGAPEVDDAVIEVEEPHISDQLAVVDREKRWVHEAAERIREADAVVGGTVDVDQRIRMVERVEERQPLDVVPVEVGDERVPADRLATAVIVAEVLEPRSQIQQNRVDVGGLDHNTRRVAAISLQAG